MKVEMLDELVEDVFVVSNIGKGFTGVPSRCQGRKVCHPIRAEIA